MRPFSLFPRLAAVAVFSMLMLTGSAEAQKTQTKKGSYPAAEGFDQAGSDPKAIAIADKVMNAMGGYDAWRNTRYLAWSFFGGQYQIWDKYTGDFHWERDTLVANYNLNTKKGEVYSRGQDISATPAGQKVLDRLTPIWINNSYWLVMPFKLKDSGVTLTYKGEGKTMDGAAADILQMTFKNVGVTPQNRYEILVNKATNLVEEWAYFPKATDEQPAFRRRWNDYAKHGQLLLAAGRDEATKPSRLDNIAAAQTIPAGVMTSKTPVAKLK
ncbi:hypothetical protein GCM10011375_23040 [Hymenobacter qilianensis]|uniref:Uncharacterized protein n=2 Tax=Hymenobacter qilianensis TaxID=1385715 RepID=A0ACB5PSI7_9BACT|nr:DUF6503 family protein [Hymenobacter qilianensis]QNP52407.1 hypothetical protein H9L05_01020 [Hymenobacter qilianensis]GGF67413.1 hypothetical protein GCM10011375_23040 [Hymenobacter qilianensis]